MKVSAKTEYACLAVLELAARFGSPEPVRIRTIADEHGIPARFLVQILLQLKGAGLVNSTRGAAGGYQLARSPAEISLWDVMTVIEGQELLVEHERHDPASTARVLHAAWRRISQIEHDHLAALSFGELADRVKQTNQFMYHI